ncbi:glycosyltransferase [Desulfopila aestuarii]|uniref:Predicted glycosyl transferase n=1 Tax=Desulfopila aestuarii DSM 18488 TaxID=1121416 RepID=A0A1M7Y8W9_9BACT|nr:glycosyltransferase [Desulfopila aestuarii]SHO49067.1 Predicted glycosyl transferase [Desulfopila aestuarii DSM 18488]
MELPRLDILLYAHDGRGLGHASRTIAIGMALRRVAPELRVLFVSGCKVSQELIGRVPLDWLKLPSYETEVVGGKSRGIVGNSMFSDLELGELRGANLEQIVRLYRPRLVLADHTPQGKHRELLPALHSSAVIETRWVLGIRGVVGAVPQARSELAAQIFMDHYRDILWYGDEEVLGGEHLALVRTQYGVEPMTCGYVSRVKELQYWRTTTDDDAPSFAGIVSVPWLGEYSLGFLQSLAEALRIVGPDHGEWKLFIESGPSASLQVEVQSLFASLEYCRLQPLSGAEYLRSLSQSRSAVIYGGYNSIMDVLAEQIPAVVVLRGMQDNEQQLHLTKLLAAAGEQLKVVEEHRVEGSRLAAMLLAILAKAGHCQHTVNLDGAERAAEQLIELLSTKLFS